MASIVLCLLILLISCFGASATHVGSRSILRVLSPDLQDAAVDFNDTSFDSVLKMTPASFAVVEFFAHWCPACRNYKPHYEKVARLFNGPDAEHPGIILMARVDCALKINIKLCDRFSIGHYPMLLWGPPLKFASGGWEPNQDTSEIRAIDDGRTAERLLNWINKQMDSSYSLDDEKYEYVHHGTNASDPGQLQERKRIYLLKNMTRVPSNLTHEQKK